jgi:hypothetical protein
MCVDFVITSIPDKAHFKPSNNGLSVAFKEPSTDEPNSSTKEPSTDETYWT